MCCAITFGALGSLGRILCAQIRCLLGQRRAGGVLKGACADAEDQHCRTNAPRDHAWPEQVRADEVLETTKEARACPRGKEGPKPLLSEHF